MQPAFLIETQRPHFPGWFTAHMSRLVPSAAVINQQMILFNVLSKKSATESKNSHRKCEQVSVSCKSLLLSKLITWQHQGYRCYPFTPCFLWGEFLDQLDGECDALYSCPFPSPCLRSCPSLFPSPCWRSCQVLCPKSGSVQLILKSANSRKAIHQPFKMKRE